MFEGFPSYFPYAYSNVFLDHYWGGVRCCHRYVMDVIHVFPEIRGVPSLMRISVERCTSQKFNLDTKNGHLQSRSHLFQGLIILGIHISFPGVHIVIHLDRFPESSPWTLTIRPLASREAVPSKSQKRLGGCEACQCWPCQLGKFRSVANLVTFKCFEGAKHPRSWENLQVFKVLK